MLGKLFSNRKITVTLYGLVVVLSLCAGCNRVAARAQAGAPATRASAAPVLDLDRHRTRGLTGDAYRRVGQYLDNPDAIFAEAHYTPLWTATSDEAKGRLPAGCTVIPHESRVWEPWFRNTLKNGDKVLTTADLLMLRDTVCLAVANDSRSRFHPPQKTQDVARAVNAVRIDTLKAIGVDSPSSVLTQLTMADAAWAWVVSQRVYGQEMSNKYFRGSRTWPTGDRMLVNNMPMSCAEAPVLMAYIIRSMEALNKQDGNPTGIQSGACMVSRYTPAPEGHTAAGARLKLAAGSFANLYYDPAPWVGGVGSNLSRTVTPRLCDDVGPMDQSSLERFTTRHLVNVYTDEPGRMGMKPTDTADGRFEGGENWPQFNLGNSAPYKDGNNGWKIRDANDGWKPFDKYHTTHLDEIKALRRAHDNGISSRL